MLGLQKINLNIFYTHYNHAGCLLFYNLLRLYLIYNEIYYVNYEKKVLCFIR